MSVPFVAELASPPIFTPAEEYHLQHAPVGDLHDDSDLLQSPSPTTTAAHSTHGPTEDLEAREKFTLVEFEPGSGENPKEWSNGKKW